jgi:phosphatidylserine/phosphatidylglycerophosphate/cardiolipin synthase-like enzyme
MEFDEMWGSSTDTPNASASRFGARKLDNTPHEFVVGGHAVECYFSPSDNVTTHIVDRINAAQHSIAFELLTLTRTDISAGLVARKNAGLKVRGDLDDDSDSGSQYAYLVGNGVDVRLKTGVSGLLHHKYCLFDAEYPLWDATTLTGSHNWSSAAEDANNENTVIIHDPDITNQYLQEFTARYYQLGGTDSVHVVAVDPNGGPLPSRVSLAQNHPNPVHGRTSFGYSLPTRQRVELRLYDVGGREVRTLVNQMQAPGNYRVELRVGSLASGVYFYRLEAGGKAQQRKMLIVR